jgi:AN1-type zinc finger protein 5/6
MHRCFVCQKRLGLATFPCKCERLFCSVHRFARDRPAEDGHICTFDFKNDNKKLLETQLPQVKPKKLEDI